MTTQRKQYSAQFKFKVALEAVKGQKTISELSSEHSVHPTQVSEWKRQLLNEGASLYSRQKESDALAQAAAQAELYEQIGRLKMEVEWLGKKTARFNRP